MWTIINEILSKNNANKSTFSLKNNGINITNKTDIANQFNNYFTNIGQTTAQYIH